MSNTTAGIQSTREENNKKRKATEPLEVKHKHGSSTIVPTVTSPHTDLNDSAEVSDDIPRKTRKISVDEIEVDITQPEPPSKKALRRFKKGKPLPPPKSGAETTPEPDDEEPKKTEAEKRSSYGIWIGNLPWSASKADVLTFLTTNSFIAAETITRIHMPGPSDDGTKPSPTGDSKRRKQQHNKGFAYVDFAIAEAVPMAINLSERLLSGRRALIKDAKSFDGRPQKIKDERKNSGKPPSKRIFVGNLRFDTTAEGLREHFEECGAVDDVMVATFEDSGKCKGYGWVTFKELKAAETAVRGWVLVEEEEEEEDETDETGEDRANPRDENGEDSMTDLDVDENQKPRSSTPRMKKNFVDKIHRRPVRREFAEDAQVRYKKRYGKDGTKAKNGTGVGAGDVDLETTAEASTKVKEHGVGRAEKVKPSQGINYPTIKEARLMGSIVESKGKKVLL